MAEAKLTSILQSLSGTLGNFNFRTTRNGIVIADLPSAIERTRTPDQQAVNAYFSASSKNWAALTDSQREAWHLFAATYYPTDKDGHGAGPTGFAVYIKVNWFRQAAGLALSTNAPTSAPPAAPTALAQVATGSDDEIAFTLGHSIPTAANHLIWTEITPPMPSPARKPRPSDHRAVKGITPASFLPLQTTGQQYTYAAARFSIPAGIRYGLKVQIISPDGVPGAPITETFAHDVI